MVKADLSGAELFHATLDEIEGTECKFISAKMHFVSLRNGRHMKKANFWKAELNNAHLIDTPFVKAIFKQADLSGTDFTGSTLFDCDLAGAYWDSDNEPIWPEGFDPPMNPGPPNLYD